MYISTPPFADTTPEDGASDDSAEDSVLQQFGLSELVDGWRKTLTSYEQTFEEWMSRARTVYQKASGTLTLSLDESLMTDIQALSEPIATVRAELGQLMTCVPAEDEEGFGAFVDAIKWIQVFLEVS